MTSVSRKAIAAVLAGSALILTAAGCSSDTAEAEPAPESTFVSKSVLEAGQANPMIAPGVAIGGGAAVYKTSGLGPAASNKAAPEGTPESYIDSQFGGGMLPAGSRSPSAGQSTYSRRSGRTGGTGTHARGRRDDARVPRQRAGHRSRRLRGLESRPTGSSSPNTNLETGDTEPGAMGTAAPAAPIERNSARPTRFRARGRQLAGRGMVGRGRGGRGLPRRRGARPDGGALSSAALGASGGGAAGAVRVQEVADAARGLGRSLRILQERGRRTGRPTISPARSGRSSRSRQLSS